MQNPVHGTAGVLQRNLERLQGAFALQGDIAQFQAAVGAGGDLGGDQQAAETSDIGGDGLRIGVREKGEIVVCHGCLLLEGVKRLSSI